MGLEMDLSRSYLATMEGALGKLDEARRREIVAETSGHLGDKSRQLMLRGLSEEASMKKTVEAFGDPAEVGRELKRVHGGATRRDALLAALPPTALGHRPGRRSAYTQRLGLRPHRAQAGQRRWYQRDQEQRPVERRRAQRGPLGLPSEQCPQRI